MAFLKAPQGDLKVIKTLTLEGGEVQLNQAPQVKLVVLNWAQETEPGFVEPAVFAEEMLGVAYNNKFEFAPDSRQRIRPCAVSVG